VKDIPCYCALTNRTLSGLRSPPRDYEIPGEGVSKIFTIIGASANLVFAFNTGMLPEIQVRQKLANLHILCLFFVDAQFYLVSLCVLEIEFYLIV